MLNEEMLENIIKKNPYYFILPKIVLKIYDTCMFFNMFFNT